MVAVADAASVDDFARGKLQRVFERTHISRQRVEGDGNRPIRRNNVAHRETAAAQRAEPVPARAFTSGSLQFSSNSTTGVGRRPRPRAASSLTSGRPPTALRGFAVNPRSHRLDISTTRSPARCSRTMVVTIVGDAGACADCPAHFKSDEFADDRRSGSEASNEHWRDEHFVGPHQTRARNRPETRDGATTPNAARTRPRCAPRVGCRAGRSASQRLQSDDGRNRHTP